MTAAGIDGYDLAALRALVTAPAAARWPTYAPREWFESIEARCEETLARFAELRAQFPETVDKDEAKTIVRELKAVGGSLKALRVALTGRERGTELWAVLRALPRDEALRRALT